MEKYDKIQEAMTTIADALAMMNLDNCNFKQTAEDIERKYPMFNMKLSEYIDYWLVTFKKQSVKASTYDRLITSVDAVKKYAIVNMSIGEITANDIQTYVNQLSSDYAYTGVLKMMRIVTAPLSKAAALHQIPTNPAVGIELPQRDNVVKKPRDTKAYTPEEQRMLLSVLNDKDRPGYYVVLFMMETGLRIGEVLALDWDDINLTKKSVSVHKTVERLANKKQQHIREGAKSHSSERRIPLSQKALELLLELKPKAKYEWVFSDSYGTRISYEAVRYQTMCACKKAGVPYKGEHVFRHTFATNSYHKEINIKLLSKMLGHSSTAITYDTYIDLYGDGFDELQSAFGN